MKSKFRKTTKPYKVVHIPPKTKKRKKKQTSFDGTAAEPPIKKLGTHWEYITANAKNLIYFCGIMVGAWFIYSGVRDESMSLKFGNALELNTSWVGLVIIVVFGILLWRNNPKVKV